MKLFLGIDLDACDDVKNYNLKDLKQLEEAINIVRLKIIEKHLNNGVEFRNISNIYIHDTVKIGSGTVIYGDQHIRGNTVIGQNCIIESGNIIENATIGNEVRIIKSVLKDCRIGNKTTVGPFANVHTGSIIERGCRIGNFVEIKNATIGVSTKMAHLSYVGDVDVGNQCNIGCGSIFVNYDGKNKHRSSVGDSVFIGSNSNIIAPVKIEDNAYIAAGTTVTIDLPKNSMCIGRNRETVKENRSKFHKNVFDKKYFGTDGIRGVYGEDLTDELAYMTGNYLGYSASGGSVVVGRDTRVSGEPLSKAIIKGITDAGANVIDLGIVSTPAVAFVTTHVGANYGVVLSASHNPAKYNGIKIFNYDGRKLTPIEEVEIETHITNSMPVIKEEHGTVSNGEEYMQSYYTALKKLIGNLSGLKVVLDCSNGALSKVAPSFFKELGAEVYSYNDSGDGSIINDGCGALHPEFCAKKVLEHNASVGFSYDGDADRLIAINGKGNVIDGDSIIYMVAKRLKNQDKLNGNEVVGTVMTNMGVEQSLKKLGIKLIRTDVGDHNVMEEMMRNNLLVGGEQSGHIILREFSNTGDGLLASLYLCKLMEETGKPLEKLDDSSHYPQFMINLETKKKKEIMSDPMVKEFTDALAIELEDKGRVLLRASGTEPKIRLMAECNKASLAKEIVEKMRTFIVDNFEL